MVDRHIDFRVPHVRAALEGRKRQHRFVLRDPSGSGWYRDPGSGRLIGCMGNPPPRVPYAVGDRLWVREAYWQTSRYPGSLPSGEPEPQAWCWGRRVHFAADGPPPNEGNRHYGPEGLRNGAYAAADPDACWIKRPSIFMLRRRSRLTLTVTEVRVQRLQEISEEDAVAEGLACLSKDGGRVYKWGIPDRDGWPGTDDDGWPWTMWCVGHRPAFAALWTSLHGADAWGANPWVAAVTFTVARRNIDGKETTDA